MAEDEAIKAQSASIRERISWGLLKGLIKKDVPYSGQGSEFVSSSTKIAAL
jgi:hypothetical protein